MTLLQERYEALEVDGRGVDDRGTGKASVLRQLDAQHVDQALDDVREVRHHSLDQL